MPASPGSGEPQGDVPGRVGSSGRAAQGWPLSPAQSCWGPAAGCDQLLSLLVAWRKFLLPENPDVVTLDPDTTRSDLVLSNDLRRVTRESTWLNLPDIPERFDYWGCVLGREGFREGRHCWEVEVEGEVGGYSWWAVGVARESVRRKGYTDRSPKDGIWAVEQYNGQFSVLTSPRTALSLFLVPRRIWVCLDCTQGRVTFINADSGVEIFTFPQASFNREILRPWFLLETEKTELCLRGNPQTFCPPSIPSTASSRSCPSPVPARSPLLRPAGAHVPLCPAQAQGADRE
ncbi:LOW QUALITY PROTEIN: butyrophilin subfamily 1 member A1-like [Theristicus caerulescens]